MRLSSLMRSHSKLPAEMEKWWGVKIVFFRQGGRGKHKISIVETLGLFEMT